MTYAPLGFNYLAWVTCVGLAVCQLQRDREWPLLRALPALSNLVALFAWLALTALWSPAGWSRIGTHLWMYALPLLICPLIAACPPFAARRALMHFVVASAVVGALCALHATGRLPPSALWARAVDAEGNQRIVTSILLAIGAALGAWFATQSDAPTSRAWWLLAAGLAALGLASQDRRTGMLALPLMLVAWAICAKGRTGLRLSLVLLVAAGSVAVLSNSDGVRARFAEGVAEFQAYRSSDEVATSWGQRLRMIERTAEMVAERPVLGHGLGSWRDLWRQRVSAGTALAEHSTPHNEYLLLAVQGGLPAALLLLAWLALLVIESARAGPPGRPALMVWLTLAVAGLFNVVLRDAKFALPLLLLAGLATSLLRDGRSTEATR